MKKLLSIVLSLAMALSLASVLPISAAAAAPEKTLSLYQAGVNDQYRYEVSYVGEVSADQVEADLLNSAAYAQPNADGSGVEYYGRAALAKLPDGESLVAAYDRICAGVEERQDTIDLSGTGIKYERIGTVYFACLYEHGEYFWLGNSYKFAQGSDIYVLYPSYLFTADELPALGQSFDAAVSELLSGIDMSADEFEREKFIHDKLALHADYDSAAVSDPDDVKAHTAYGCIVEKSCVCDGYAKAFECLLHKAGIQAMEAVGTANGGGHAWNIVRINGEYYQTDLTWDDPVPASEISPLFYSYFNLTNEEMAKDHYLSTGTLAYSLPACTATEENYYNHYNARYDTYDYDSFVEIAKVSRVVLPGMVVVHFDDTTMNYGTNGVQGVSRGASDPRGDAEKIAEAIGMTDYTECQLVMWSTSLETFTLYGDTSGVGSSADENVIAKGYCGGEYPDGKNLAWRLLDDGSLIISGSGAMKDYSILDTPWEDYRRQLKTVRFEGTPTTISDSAFRNCNIVSAEIPASMESIAANAFERCFYLEEINVDENSRFFKSVDGVVYSKDMTTLVRYPSGKRGESYTIPSTVKILGEQAIFQSLYLKTINIPDGVEKLDTDAIGDCDSIISIVLPDSVTSVGIRSIGGCSRLAEIKLSSNLKTIGIYAFNNNDSLEEIIIPISVETIERGILQHCSKLKTIYCEAESKPAGWDTDWAGENYQNPDIIWGYCPHTSCTDVPEVPATCTEPGVKAHQKCNKCGKLLVDGKVVTEEDLVIKPAHKPSEEWIKGEETHWHVCSVCGEKVKEAAHEWNSGEVTKAPTCTEKGVKTFTCTVCEYERTAEIDADGHTYGEEYEFDENGHWHKCTACGDKSDVESHNLEEIIDKEPTEEEAGSKHFECTVCEYKSAAASIPPLDHTHKMEHVAAKASTCLEQGNVEYWHCTKCGLNFADADGEKVLDDVTLPLGDHDYVEHEEVPATHGKDGCKAGIKKHYTCSVCGKIFDMDKNETTEDALVIPVVHDYGNEWAQGTDTHWHECECGEKSDEAAHDYTWVTVTEATTLVPGSRKGTCKVCGYEKTEEIPKTEPVQYDVISGDSSWAQGSDDTVTVRVGADIDKFVGVEVDGSTVGTDDYVVKSGSTIVTLKNSYLRTLAAGVHSLTIVFSDGKCNTSFVVNPAASTWQPPVYNAPVYLSETLHGLYVGGRMMPYPHTADALGLRTDGVNTWYVCGVCGHVFGMADAVTGEPDDEAEFVDADTPTESGDNSEETENVTADDRLVGVDSSSSSAENNPATGFVLSVLPMLLAAIAVLVGKKR